MPESEALYTGIEKKSIEKAKEKTWRGGWKNGKSIETHRGWLQIVCMWVW